MNAIDRKVSGPRCPICGTTTEVAFKPFCSKRCADIDLNRWLTGVYAVPLQEDDDEDGLRPADGKADDPS
ncbi:MAG: DNA gyrase inhibitor YacG [Pseudolabrys sp.]|nr:DNA gyrase inhibitor YacG [Pseudolabrys sp.]